MNLSTFVYSAYVYDVWGNEIDGYWVNNRLKVREEVLIPEHVLCNDARLKQFIKPIFGLKARVRLSSIHIEGEDDTGLFLTHEPTGYPIGELIFVERRDAYVELKNQNTHTIHFFDGSQHYKGPLRSICGKTFNAESITDGSYGNYCQACVNIELRQMTVAGK